MTPVRDDAPMAPFDYEFIGNNKYPGEGAATPLSSKPQGVESAPEISRQESRERLAQLRMARFAGTRGPRLSCQEFLTHF